MRLSPLSLLLPFLLAAPLVHAQRTGQTAGTSVYAVAGFSAWGTDLNNEGRYSFPRSTSGFGGGVFYNLPIQSRVTLGFDGRVHGGPGYNGNNSGLLAGAALRVGLVPHRNLLRPFFQIGGGFVRTSYTSVSQSTLHTITTSRQSVTSGALQLDFGLDIRLTDSLDLRAPEFGAQAGGRAAASFLNAGLVLHLHPRRS